MGSHDGHVRALDIDKGDLIWKINVQAPVLAWPMQCSSNSLICTTLKGAVFKISSSEGQVLWHKFLDSPVFSTPTMLAKAHVIIIATVKGVIYTKV